jgi:hypothetical protein
MDWFGCKTYGNPQLVSLEDVFNVNHTSRQNFCAFVGNHTGNKRQEAIDSLAKYKSVFCQGKPFGNHNVGEDKKLDVLRQHKFTICFENTIYPGYHTEKLFHAKVTGCLPLYNGSLTVEKDFNAKGFLNLQNFSSIEEFCDIVRQLDQNNDLFEEIRQQPLFLAPPSLDSIKQQIKDTIK